MSDDTQTKDGCRAFAAASGSGGPTEAEVSKLLAMARESTRLGKLTNKELVRECLNSDAADYFVVEEMMNRLHPGWENDNLPNSQLSGEPKGKHE